MAEPQTTIDLINALIASNTAAITTLTANYNSYLSTYNSSVNNLTAQNAQLQEAVDVILKASTDATTLSWIKSGLGLA